MKKSNYLCISISMVFLLSIMFSQRAFAQGMAAKWDKELRAKAIEIQAKNPGVPRYVLQKDINFIKSNWRQIAFAKMGLPMDSLIVVTAGTWEDIRSKNIVEPNTPLNSIDQFDRYGLLRVNSIPTGATVILNEKETWDKKTNTQKGVHSGSCVVGVSLKDYEPDQKNVTVPEGGDVTVAFELKKKK